MGRITEEAAVTTLANTDVLIKDNPSTGSAKIAWSDFMAQIQALFLTGGKLSSSLVPSSFAGGIQYKGTVAGASVPASSGATGDYYLIASAGTSQAITWAVGDFAVWNGAAWQKVAMAGAYTTPPDVANVVNPRAPMQGLVFDGTAGASVAGVPAFGTGDVTVEAFGKLDTTGTSGAFSILGIPSLSIYVNGADSKIAAWNNYYFTPALTRQKWFHLVISRTGGTSTLYVNGVSADTHADAINVSSAPAKVGSLDTGANVWVGPLGVRIYNRALSAAEITALYESGAPAASDFPAAKAGTQNVTTGDFSSSTGWTVGSGWSIAGGVAVSAGTGDGGTGTELSQSGKTFRAGERVRVSYTLANVTSGDFKIVFYGGTANTSTALRSANGTYTEEVTLVGSATGFLTSKGVIGPLNNGATLDNLSIVSLGLLAAFDPMQPGNGLVWTDVSGNRAHIVLPVAGVTWALPGNAPTEFTSRTTTNGNQQMLGAGCVEANVELELWGWTETGTTLIDIGTASGGAQIVAGGSLGTTPGKLTQVGGYNHITTGSALWVKADSTNPVIIQVRPRKITK